MPEFDFYGVQQDWKCLLERLAQQRHMLVLDRYYRVADAPSLPPTSALVRKAISNGRALYVRGAFTGAEQPIFDKVPRKGFFLVDFQNAMLRLSLPTPERMRGSVVLHHASLVYPKVLWNADLTRSWLPSPELKRAYRELVKDFKTCLRKQQDGALWIGQHAWNLLVKGDALIFWKGNWWSFRGGLVKKQATRT